MHWIRILAPLANCLLLVNAQSCSRSTPPQRGDVFIQKYKASASVLADDMAPWKKNSKFANLLAKEMDDLVVAKGQSGLSPEEIEHIHTIKDLIMNSIIPSIADGVADSKAELDELYQAVTDCASHVKDALAGVKPLENTTNSDRDLHKDCRKQEDEMKEDKEEACQDLEKAQLGVHAPELDFELGIDMSDEEMLRYLRTMNEHFCGRWKDFEDTWEECEALTDNHTDHSEKCDDLQEDFEESFCAWKSELEGACKNFDKCWTDAVARFNERKTAIETLQASRIEEYEAAVKVNCLWDAWKWEDDPCTVDEEKVKECTTNLHPNTTNVSLTIPELPTPPECDVDVVSVHPCTEQFLEEEYAILGVSADMVEDMKSKCTACPELVLPHETAAAAELQRTGVSTSLKNLMAVAGTMYVKTGGVPGKCDGALTTPQGSTTSVKVTVLQASSKVEVSLSDGDHTHKMLLENDVASAGDETVLFSADEDTMGIAIANDKVQYLKAGKPFAEEPAYFSLGSANVAVCTAGASVDVKLT